MPTESAVEGHARLLRAEILARLGELDRADEELDAAAKLRPPAPPPALAEVRDRASSGSAAAMTTRSGRSTRPGSTRSRATRWRSRSGSSSVASDHLGSDRTEAEADAFRRARTLRGSDRPEARRAMNELARTFDEPPPHAEPEAWDLLGEAALGSATPPGPAGSSPPGPTARRTLQPARRGRAGSALARARSSSRPATTPGPTRCSAAPGTTRRPARRDPRPACSAPWLAAGPGRGRHGGRPRAGYRGGAPRRRPRLSRRPGAPSRPAGSSARPRPRTAASRRGDRAALAVDPARPSPLAPRAAGDRGRADLRELDELRIGDDPAAAPREVPRGRGVPPRERAAGDRAVGHRWSSTSPPPAST